MKPTPARPKTAPYLAKRHRTVRNKNKHNKQQGKSNTGPSAIVHSATKDEMDNCGLHRPLADYCLEILGSNPRTVRPGTTGASG